MIETWEDLRFWQSGEWQVVEEHLEDREILGINICPSRENLFNALDECPFDKCKVMFMGQDPYPVSEHAMGLAFSVPKHVRVLPHSLSTIFDEYQDDLGYDRPMNGDLTDWAHEGVLLWNSVPSCNEGLSLSHDWPEWKCLTEEIISYLASKGIVFVLVGSHARKFAKLVKDLNNCRMLYVDHPSPRASLSGRNPFRGSRVFSKTNLLLGEIGWEPVEWRLPCAPKTSAKSSERKSKGGLRLATNKSKKTLEKITE